MKKFLLIVTLSVFISNFAIAQTGEIVISDRIRVSIENELAKVNKTFPIETQKMEENQLFFRTWVSGSIDLKKATKRVSERFKRTTYKQEVKSEKLRLPKERLKIIKKRERKSFWRFWEKGELQLIPKLQIDTLKQVGLEKPVTVLYREGLQYFKYAKLKETKPQVALQESQAIESAKKFLIENSFLKETNRDKIGNVYVQNHRINEDKGEGNEPSDYLVQQDIVFERHYDNKPVINSKIVLGILPDTKEIVLFKHFKWTPLQEQKETTISKQKLIDYGSGSREEIQRRLEQKIRKTSGKFSKAEVKNVIPAWFQLEESLIPVLCFDVYIEHPSPVGTLSRNYLEVINLLGSDDMLFEGRKPSESPIKAPR